MEFALRAAVLLALVYGALVALLYLGQRSLMYFPDGNRPDKAAAGLPQLAEVRLRTADGLELLAWHRAPDGELPTFVYFHGNAGSIQHRGFKLRPIVERGFGLLAVEYRGYGGNPGRPSELGLRRDGQAALRFLEERGTPADRIVLYGESLGTGIATAMAHEMAGRGTPARALVLEAPFTSIADIAAAQFPVFPVRLLLKDRFDNRSLISEIGCPLLILHGGRDAVVPVGHGQALFAAAIAPKRLEILEAAGHEDVHQQGGLVAVWQFLGEPASAEP